MLCPVFGVYYIIASLSEISVSNADVTEKIEENVTYFTNNKDRMRYNEYKEKGYHIGSGTVESACKHLWDSGSNRLHEMVIYGC